MIRTITTAAQLLSQAAAAAAGDLLLVGAGSFDLGATPLNLPDGVHLQGAGRTLTTLVSAATFSDGAIVKPGSGSIIQDLSITGTGDFLTFQAPIGFLTGAQSAFTSAVVRRCNLSAYSDGIYLKGSAAPAALRLAVYDCNFSTGYDNTRIITTGAGSWDCILDLFNCTCESLNPTGIGNDNRCHSISIGTLRLFGGLHRAIVGAGTGYAACLHVDAAAATLEAYGAVLESSNGGSGAVYDAYRQAAGTLKVNLNCTYNAGKSSGTITRTAIPAPASAFTNTHCARRNAAA